MKERAVLMVVDVQVDFCPGGSLAVPGGNEIIPAINRYIELFRKAQIPVFATRDWHPGVTTHFREFGGLWPPHCIQETPGALFHPALKLPEEVTVLSKGMDPKKDDYSSFKAQLASGLPLDEHLRASGIDHIYICGLATDYCVRETALDAMREGLEVTVLKDAVKGVDLRPGDSERALEEISRAGGELADFSMIEAKFKNQAH